MVAQRRNGLFKHLSPMTWPEAKGEDSSFRAAFRERSM